MRPKMLALLLAGAGLAGAQSMTEFAAAAAGGSAGGVSGKKVSDGLSAIFNKVDQHAAAAAAAKNEPLMKVGPGVPKPDQIDPDGVPAPPPVRQTALHKGPVAPSVREISLATPPPPPPVVTTENLKQLSTGTSREEVLKIGQPSDRITMFDDGHLVEVYHYSAKDNSVFGSTPIGSVRLSDGVVSSVAVK